MGRFLYAPLKLQSPEPEVFRLALESAANEELAVMSKGDKNSGTGDCPVSAVGATGYRTGVN